MGGNFAINGYKATKIDLESYGVENFRSDIKALLSKINDDFYKIYKFKIRRSIDGIFSGSTSYIMDPKYDADEIIKYKKNSGDCDVMIPKELGPLIFDYLKTVSKINKFKFVGMSANNRDALGTQIITLWNWDKWNIQIDLELSNFKSQMPSNWAKFSHSSSFEDAKQNIKAVHHKYFLRAIARVISSDPNVVIATNKSTAASIKLKKINGNPHKLGFSVDKGLGTNYEPLNTELDKKQVVRELKPVEKNYITDPELIFFIMFPGATNYSKEFESFDGLNKLIKRYYNRDFIEDIVSEYFDMLFGDGAQVIESWNADLGRSVKLAGLDYALKFQNLKIPNLDSKIDTYYKRNFKIRESEITNYENMDFESFKSKYFPNSTFKKVGRGFKVNRDDFNSFVNLYNIPVFKTKMTSSGDTIEIEVNNTKYILASSGSKNNSGAKSNTDFKELFVCICLLEKINSNLDPLSNIITSKSDILSSAVDEFYNFKPNSFELKPYYQTAEAILDFVSSSGFSISNYKIHWQSSEVKTIRSIGSKLSGLREDKWCPADIYLINKMNLKTDNLIDFNDSISDFKNIIPISLKQGTDGNLEARKGKCSLNTVSDILKLNKCRKSNYDFGEAWLNEFSKLLNKLKNSSISNYIFIAGVKNSFKLSDNFEFSTKYKVGNSFSSSLPIIIPWILDNLTSNNIENVLETAFRIAGGFIVENPKFIVASGNFIETKGPGNPKPFGIDKIIISINGEMDVRCNIIYGGVPIKLQCRSFGSLPQFEYVGKPDSRSAQAFSISKLIVDI